MKAPFRTTCADDYGCNRTDGVVVVGHDLCSARFYDRREPADYHRVACVFSARHVFDHADGHGDPFLQIQSEVWDPILHRFRRYRIEGFFPGRLPERLRLTPIHAPKTTDRATTAVLNAIAVSTLSPGTWPKCRIMR